MLASEMIIKLQALIEEYGDKPVKMADWSDEDVYNDVCVKMIVAYDSDGNFPVGRSRCAEFYLHSTSD